MGLGALAVRATVGPLFVGHGAQKLFGAFGGHGIEGTGGFMESLGLEPGRRNAIAAGTSELVGGALLTAGALTPVASTLVSSTMLTAIQTAHKGKGPWVTEGGWEYNATLVALATWLAEHGPGPLALDNRMAPRFRGPAVALASLAAAAVGSYLVTSGKATELADTATGVAQDAASTVREQAEGRFARSGDAEPEQMADTPAATTLPG